MTREEAIKYLIKPVATSTEIGEEKQKEFEAYNMAIEALSADTVPIEKYHELQHQFVMLGATFADLTEVVRCKDCRYFKKIAERSDSGLCHRDIIASAWKENGYCSRGERREP